MAEKKLSDTLLHAFVDGRLDPQQNDEVEALLRANPGQLQEARDHRLVNDQLHVLFDPALNRPVPNKVLALLNDELDNELKAYSDDACAKPVGGENRVVIQAKSYPVWLTHSIAAGVLLFVGTLIGWISRDHWIEPAVSPAAALAALAMDAHRLYAREKRHAVEVTAADKDHLMNWLSARLGAPVGPVDLRPHGFNLLGGRLLPAAGKSAGVYLYSNSEDVRLTFYVTNSPGEIDDPLECAAHEGGGLAVCTWAKGSLLNFVLAEIPPDELRNIAEHMRAHTEPGNGK